MRITTTVIYADTLLVVNFSMDFLALFIAGKLLHTKISPLKTALGSLCGAVYSLIAVIADAYLTSAAGIAVSIIGGMLCALLMVFISFGGRLRGIITSALTYGAVNVGLGGIMTALYGIAGSAASRLGAQPVSASPDSSPILFALITVISGAVSLAYGKFTEKHTKRKKVRVTIGLCGNEAEATLLCDSGNLLCEPFGGKPVIIVSSEFISNLISDEQLMAVKSGSISEMLGGQLRRRVRLIPADGVLGSGMLIGFVPDSIQGEGRTYDAVVAVDTSCNEYDGCEGIIPQALLNV